MSEVVPVLESTRTLDECEAVIRRGLNSFIEVGEALMEIRDNRLYREKGFSRFEDYCQQEWKWTHRHANRLIESAEVVHSLGPIGPILPATESQARELVPLMRQDEAEMVETWNELRETYGDKITAAKIKDVVERKLTRETIMENRKELPRPSVPDGIYSVIYADPAWEYRNSGLMGSAESHYMTMPTADICALPIPQRSADDAVLFLWATNPLLPDAMQVLKAWEFEYKTNFVWIKDRSTYGKLGFYNYGRHEILIIATRGSMLPRCKPLPDSVLPYPKTEHSRKPTEIYDLIETMYPEERYLELFARSRRDGWQAFGNEVPNE